MINKRYISVVLILLFLVGIVNAQENCYFNTFNDNCERISTSSNSYTIEGFSAPELYERHEVSIYEKNNPSNKLRINQQDLSIEQLTPFLEPGVYVVDVKVYDKAKNSFSKKFEYIFDNTKPLPPTVPLGLQTNTGSISFTGKAKPQSTLYVKNSQNQIVTQKNIGNDGEYSITLSSLNSGLNHFRFFIRAKNGFESEVVERIIFVGEKNPEYNPSVNSLEISPMLQNINERTVFENGKYITSKRTFYIEGDINAPDGSVVYINGVRTISADNKFAGFVLLNEGENTIEVVSGYNSDEIEVVYTNPRFMFVNVESEKIIKSDSVIVEGETNLDLEFLVFLNGEFIREIMPQNNLFSFDISNLKEGKNIIQLLGRNSQKYTKIIYVDTQEPQASILRTSFSSPDELIFEIKDDVGVDLSSVRLDVDGSIYHQDDLKILNDFFIFDTTDLQAGSHSYTLEFSDLTDRQKSISGNINIDGSMTLIDDLLVEGSNVIGNKLFLKEGESELIIVPSKNIAFKSIFMDDIEQTDYIIGGDNRAKLKIEPQNDKGTLELKFIDNTYTLYSEIYNYEILSDDVIVDLDYVEDSIGTQRVKISGEIHGDYLDWESMIFNSQNDYVRFGKYFEANVELESSGYENLVFVISDYAGNNYNYNFGSLLYKDTTKTGVVLNSRNGYEFSNYVDGSLRSDFLTESVNNLNFVSSYDGYSFDNTYIDSESFALPLSEVPGIRSINLKGYESSGKRYDSISKIDVNYSELEGFSEVFDRPKIYFNGNDKKVNSEQYFIQGSIASSAEIEGVTVDGATCEFDSISFLCFTDFDIGKNNFTIRVVDVNGKSSEETYDNDIIRVNPVILVSLDDIKGENIEKLSNRYYLFGDEFDVEGKVNKNSVISVLVGGDEKLVSFEDSSFTLNVDYSLESRSQDSNSIELQLKAEDEFGNVGFSNKLKLYYTRVLETFAQVFVE